MVSSASNQLSSYPTGLQGKGTVLAQDGAQPADGLASVRVAGLGALALFLLGVFSYLDPTEQWLHGDQLRIVVFVSASCMLILSASWVLTLVSVPVVYLAVPKFIEPLTWGQQTVELQIVLLALLVLSRFAGTRLRFSSGRATQSAERVTWKPSLGQVVAFVTLSALGLGIGRFGADAPDQRSAMVWLVALAGTSIGVLVFALSHAALRYRCLGIAGVAFIAILTLCPVQAKDVVSVYLAIAGILTQTGWTLVTASLLRLCGWRVHQEEDVVLSYILAKLFSPQSKERDDVVGF